ASNLSAKHVRPSVVKLKHAWFAVQVSHRGKYSIERLLALDEYTRSTSWWRVLLVCVSTPLPMVLLVISQELLPLQDPSDGWRANEVIWLRTAIQAGVIALATGGQAVYLIDGVVISPRQLMMLFFSVALGYTAVAMVVAAYVAFPIPFMAISMSPVFFTIFVVSCRVIVGGRVFCSILEHRDQLFRFVGFLSAQTLMSVVYPFYQVLFNKVAAETQYELAVFLLLPLIKIVMKNIVSFSMAHMEDMIPESVIFTVDFFNGIYVATCMQSTSSTITIATMMAIDLAKTTLALRDLHHRTNSIMTRLHEVVGVNSAGASLLAQACSLCCCPNKFQKQERMQIRLHSCLPHRLSLASRRLLDSLEELPINSYPARSVSSQSTPSCTRFCGMPTTLMPRCLNRYGASIQPALRLEPALPEKFSELEPVVSSQLPQHCDVLRETLEILFTSECLVLTEYLASVVPIFYGSFMLVMVHLPSAQYHTELAGVTTTTVGSKVQAVFVYALLEFLSFVMFATLMQRKCGMRTLYHLAFVLETQMPLVQGKMMIWMLMTMGFRVVHFGTNMAAPLKQIAPSDVASFAYDPVDPQALADASVIVSDVRQNGLPALRAHAVRLGDVPSTDAPLLLPKSALQSAFEALPKLEQQVLQRTTQRVRVFAQAQRDSIGNFQQQIAGGFAGQDVRSSLPCPALASTYPTFQCGKGADVY
ncbi:hypothetical protein BBJ28_00016391, partial [Nothophytophthora sp. Chile5]